MKKYFMKNTEDELQFGDMIELDLTEDMENGGVKHKHLECKFAPDLVDMLLEADVIEVQEVEGEEEEEDTEDVCPVMQDLLAANEDLELKVENLEKEVAALKKVVASMIAE